MAIIDANSQFDADSIDNQIVGIAAMVGTHDSGMHRHHKHQLLFAASGCMSISLDGAKCILPPTRAAWIPAGVEHYARMSNVVAYRSLYFDVDICTSAPDAVTVFSINSLLRELIERMAMWAWDKPTGEQTHMTALFFEELQAAPKEELALPLPGDRRLANWLDGVLRQDYLPQPLNQVANTVGASAKTVSRIFSKETGMPYQSWRQQWRLMMGIQSLSEGNSVADTAASLDFSSDSAFVAFFRQQTGETPGKYIIEGR